MSGGGRRAERVEEHYGRGRGAAVVIVSTTAAAGTAEDATGPVLVDWLRGRGYDCPAPIVVADGEPVAVALRELVEQTPAEERPRVVVTSGGTGLNPDDRTPEATEPLLERQVPGVMHALWAAGLANTPTAVLSRGVAGVRGATFLVNLPGSRGGVRDGIAVLDGLLPHLQAQIEDEHGHGERR